MERDAKAGTKTDGRDGRNGRDGNDGQRVFGIAVMLCGFFILLDLFLIASLSVRGGMAP